MLPRARRGAILGPLLFVLAVVGGSVLLLRWQQREHEAAQPARFAGSRTATQLVSRLRETKLDQPIRVDILRDSASNAWYGGPATLDSITEGWMQALSQVGAVPRVVTPAQALADHDAAVLVVPATPCLGAVARHAIEERGTRHQGLLLTWMTGVRDGGCKGVGYGLVTAAATASRVDTLHPRHASYVTVLGDDPLATDIPPGARLELNLFGPVAVRSPLRSAYFSDFTLNPDPNASPYLDGAVARGVVGGARAVFWGFDINRVVRQPWSQSILLRLVRNSIAWAADIPVVGIEPWPGDHRAAAVIAQDVEDEFANARYAVDTLQAAGVRGTYYLVSALALRNRDLVAAMAKQGEVGSHTPRHQLLGGTTRESQQAALDRTQRDLASLLGKPVAGLRPPEEQYDKLTLSAWQQAGGSYLFGANNARVAAPEIVEVDGREFVLLGRMTNDDFISVHRAGNTDPKALAREYLASLEKVKALGGLYVLSYHSQMLSRPELVPALGIIARHIAADSTLWTTTAGEVADWWLRRSRVKVDAQKEPDGSVRIVASNGGTKPLEDAVLRIVLDGGPASAASGATLLAPDELATRLLLTTLAPGESRTIHVTPTRGGSHATR
ncbi:MAG: hypothetical protein JWO05_3361 [Gemmatimonadetes bacterium]|nr:hypothetical protein [Gemmatimonadota bacterium]